MSEGAAPGRVRQHLYERLRHGPLHLTLIDPEKSPGERAGEVARIAAELGTDGIMLGGSTGITPDRMGAAARAVRAATRLPTIIFPEGPGSLSGEADAVFFMSLLNSKSLEYVIGAHARSSLAIRSLGIEPIALGYLVVAPGMRVGQVGQVDPVGREDLRGAQGYALAAEYLGMHFVYLEAGSGAPAPVPPAMVRAVREILRVPLIVGGGIRSGRDAATLLDAGAQLLVTGTVTEGPGAGTGLREIVSEVKRARGG